MKQILLLKNRILGIDFEGLRAFCFIFLFAAEFAYYLLILQTAVIPIFEKNFLALSFIPIGAVFGVVFTVFMKNEISLLQISLFIQTIMMFFYPNYGYLDLFILGFLSSITVTILIFMVSDIFLIALSLGISYAIGTLFIGVDIYNRGDIAVLLSLMALFFSLFQNQKAAKKFARPAFKEAFEIFLWIFLDSLLFEMLIRDDSVGIWGREEFIYPIILFHIVGIFIGYFLLKKKYFSFLVLILFGISYLFFIFKEQNMLCVVYPIVISMYNVKILQKMSRMSYELVAFFAMILWFASSSGLFLAVNIQN